MVHCAATVVFVAHALLLTDRPRLPCKRQAIKPKSSSRHTQNAFQMHLPSLWAVQPWQIQHHHDRMPCRISCLLADPWQGWLEWLYVCGTVPSGGTSGFVIARRAGLVVAGCLAASVIPGRCYCTPVTTRSTPFLN